jgi:hypothetical protein
MKSYFLIILAIFIFSFSCYATVGKYQSYMITAGYSHPQFFAFDTETGALYHYDFYQTTTNGIPNWPTSWEVLAKKIK